LLGKHQQATWNGAGGNRAIGSAHKKEKLGEVNMANIQNERQAINKAASLLALKEYEVVDEVNNISRIFLAQMFVFKLYAMIQLPLNEK
jgi:hypothetical protein